MGAVYCVDERLVEEKPEIEVMGRRFKVDNRMSAFLKMSEALKGVNERSGEFEAVCRYGLGGDGWAAVSAMDLSVAASQRLIVLILAAMQGIEAEEAEARFRK